MKERSLKLNAVLNIIRTAMSLIFPLITFPYSSRILGPEGTGSVAYVASIVSYFSIIAGLGIGTYGTREAAKIRDDSVKFNKFVKEVFTINLISTAVAYILFFIVIFTIPKLFEYRPLLLIYCANIIFSTLGMDWIYSAEEDYTYITIRSIIFQIIGVVLLFVMVRTEKDIVQYTCLSVITGCGSNILNFLHVHKYVNFKSVTQKLELKKHLKPIFTLFGTVVAVSLYTILDTTMLGALSGAESVGIYNAATKINRIVISMIAAVGTVASPRMSNYVETDKEKYKELLKTISNFYLILCIPCAAGLCFLAEPIIMLFCGDKFVSAAFVMQLMAPVVLLVPFGAFFSDQIFTPMRKDKYSLVPVVVGACVNFVCNLILIPKYQAVGAAIASVAAELIVTIIKIVLSTKVIDYTGKLFGSIWQYIIAVICMIAALYFYNKAVNIDNVIEVLLSIVIGALVYYLALLIMHNKLVLQYTRKVIHR